MNESNEIRTNEGEKNINKGDGDSSVPESIKIKDDFDNMMKIPVIPGSSESPDLASTTQDINTSALQHIREKCKYGEKCYRKNPEHKAKYSHPGDSDYNEPDNREECPYGKKCYRKNPLHKVQYKHTMMYGRRKCNTSCKNKNIAHIDLAELDDLLDDEEEEESIDESEYEPTSSEEDSDDDEDEEYLADDQGDEED